jgi:O-antigen/teichoic acid export membrane protein
MGSSVRPPVEPSAPDHLTLLFPDSALSHWPQLAREVLRRVAGFVVQRFVSIAKLAVFARLFAPEALGQLALVLAVVTATAALANLGTREAVIRDPDRSAARTDTTFTLSAALALALLGLLISLAYPVGSPLLGPETARWLLPGSILVLAVPAMFPVYLWERDLQFGRVAVPGVLSELVSLIATFGLWRLSGHALASLIGGHLAGFMVATIWTWSSCARWPRLRIDGREVRPLLAFGVPVALDALNVQVTLTGDNLLVGWLWGAAALGFYNVARSLPMTIASTLAIFDAMTLPLFAQAQRHPAALRALFAAVNKGWAVIGFPLGCLLALYAPQTVRLLYGVPWEPAIPILRVMAISFALRFATGYAYGPLAVVRGRTAYLFKWGCVNSLFVLLVGGWMIKVFGPIGGAWFWIVQLAVLGPLVRFPLILQELGTLADLRQVLPPIGAGVAASLVTALVLLIWPDRVLVSAALFVTIYLGMLLLTDATVAAWGRAVAARAGITRARG